MVSATVAVAERSDWLGHCHKTFTKGSLNCDDFPAGFPYLGNIPSDRLAWMLTGPRSLDPDAAIRLLTVKGV